MKEVNAKCLQQRETQLSRSRAKDNAKGYGICIPEELKEEKEEKKQQ